MSKPFLTLTELNQLISGVIGQTFPDTYWILGETSDVRQHRNGHCYLELIEKNGASDNITAKNRGYIWSNVFAMLKPYFEGKTGQAFASGLKVLVKVSVDYHPVYGLGLNILDIDPTYTLGDLQRRRQEILNQLEAEGILTLNKELEFPLLPQRIAVITSPTAAGYEDFLKHLTSNPAGLVFYPRLFPAIMQGERTEASIVQALEKIYECQDLFDVVVIIRGGGASSDLLAFDSYLLASHCAQFPLPIITGIGHERDVSVLDYVACHSTKTPTAVADYLIVLMEGLAEDLLTVQDNILSGIEDILYTSGEQLKQLARQIPVLVNSLYERRQHELRLKVRDIRTAALQYLDRKENQLKAKDSFLKLSSPQYILSRGYSITYKDGKVVKSAALLKKDDQIQTVLAEGTIESRVVGGES